MIITDPDYKTVISKLEKTGYAKTAYSEINTEMATGVGIIVLFQDSEDPHEIRDINYSSFDQILENKPSDLVVIDLEKGQFQFMALKSVLEKREQEKEPEPYNSRCSCCD